MIVSFSVSNEFEQSRSFSARRGYCVAVINLPFRVLSFVELRVRHGHGDGRTLRSKFKPAIVVCHRSFDRRIPVEVEVMDV